MSNLLTSGVCVLWTVQQESQQIVGCKGGWDMAQRGIYSCKVGTRRVRAVSNPARGEGREQG
jgi:hypothetical protein